MRHFINLITENQHHPLELAAVKLGVVLDIFDAEDRIELHWIERTTGAKGNGAKVMQMLCDYADEHKRIILLDPDGGSDEIGAYYNQFGFDDFDSDEAEDHWPGWEHMMIRYPNA